MKQIDCRFKRLDDIDPKDYKAAINALRTQCSYSPDIVFVDDLNLVNRVIDSLNDYFNNPKQSEIQIKEDITMNEATERFVKRTYDIETLFDIIDKIDKCHSEHDYGTEIYRVLYGDIDIPIVDDDSAELGMYQILEELKRVDKSLDEFKDEDGLKPLVDVYHRTVKRYVNKYPVAE
jgi:hypothetical protein